MSLLYVESPHTDPAWNLALEQYVFDSLPRDNEYFMLWQNDNAIIVGKNQNTVEEINASYVREHGIRVVRRLSGGGAVYHDLGNINFTFIVDASKAETLDLQGFCLPVARALGELGVHAEVSGRNDISIDGRKFSGNAQYIKNGRVMHHGTIMFDSDLSVLVSALNVPKDKYESKSIKSVRSRVTNVKPHIAKEITLQQFWSVLRRFLAGDADASQYLLTEEDLKVVEALREARYAAWEWNYGYSPKYSIRKERRIEGVGKIQVCMDVEDGKILRFAAYGDYFGLMDASELAEKLIGCPLEEDALVKILNAVPVDKYFNNLETQELIRLLLQ
jgi:lipoate-protein ligase A